MKEFVDFRIPEERAKQYLEPQDGTTLGGTVRKLVLSVDDPRYDKIGKLERKFLRDGQPFFLGWQIKRHYAKKELEAAEERINKANSRIAGLSKDPKYIATKRMLSIWIGLLLGLIVAIISDSGILEALQIGVPRILDMIVTGFVIGAGSGPMHSLMGILQGTKNTLESLGELASLAPLKKQIKELQDQIREN